MLSDIIGSALNDTRYADFTICCGDKEWKVHSAILCPQVCFLCLPLQHHVQKYD